MWTLKEVDSNGPIKIDADIFALTALNDSVAANRILFPDFNNLMKPSNVNEY